VPTVWLPKLKLVGEKEAAGAVPVPLSETLCGLPVALSVTVTVPFAAPATVGVKVTLIVHFASEASVAPQVFVSAKLALAAIAEIVRLPLPVLVSVRGRG
jgi:hypothetical protein